MNVTQVVVDRAPPQHLLNRGDRKQIPIYLKSSQTTVSDPIQKVTTTQVRMRFAGYEPSNVERSFLGKAVGAIGSFIKKTISGLKGAKPEDDGNTSYIPVTDAELERIPIPKVTISDSFTQPLLSTQNSIRRKPIILMKET
jgi:hypothetical protein